MTTLKHISLVFVSLLLVLVTHAQNVSINSTGALPDNSAMLDVSSTNKGVLLPRMTSAQRSAIVNPAQGLMIFQTDGNSGLWVYDTNSVGWGLIPMNSSTPSLDSVLAAGNNANGVNIVNTGKIGIGTATPGSAELSILDTAANIALTSTNTSSWASMRMETPSSSYSLISSASPSFNGGFFIKDNTANTNRFAIDSNGNVGIGTLSPGSKMHVLGTLKLSGSDTSSIFNSTVASRQILNLRAKNTVADGAGINMYGDNDITYPGAIRFLTGGDFNASMWIDSNENVAIGNQVPTQRLDVAGNVKADSVVIYDGTNAPTPGDVLTAIDANGRAYWTTPAAADGNGIYDGSGSLSGTTNVTFGANQLNFITGATQGFNVDGTTFSVDGFNNRVGVGNINPTTTLDVNGGIRSGAPGTDGQLTLYSEQGATDYTVVFNPNAAMTQTTTYTLPPNDGNANDVLTSDGSGSLSWGTQSGNGIYSGSGSLTGATTVTQAANTLSFTSTATNGFSVDGTTFSVDAANNRVGFGTSSPTYHMHLLKTTGTAHFTMETQDSSVVQMRLINSVRSYGIAATSYGNLSFIDHNAATNIIRMRLDSTGRFGIGSSNPAYKLDVGGTIRSGWNLTDGQLRIYSEQGATDYEVVFNPNAGMTQTTTYTLPPNDGNASQVLTTDGAGVLSWAAPTGDNLGNHTATQNIQLGSFWLSGDGGNEGIYVNASGRVGFGTNAPAARFHILDNSGPLDILLETPDTASAKIEFRNALHEYRVGVNPDSSFAINDASAGVRRLIMTATGKFGLGMGNSGIPSYTLDVKGAIRAGNNNADGQLRIYSEQGATDYEVVFNPPATMTQNTTYTLPANDGNANDMLISNGSGILSWGSTATIGNGIYSGSGSLTGATTVTQAANTLAFTSTATNGFSVDGTTFSVDALNNRIGVGTASPSELIHLRATGVSNTLLFQNNNNITTNSNSLGRIHFGDNQTTLTQAAIWADRDGTSSSAADLPTRLGFYTMADGTASLTEKMRITNSGNVGIGTSSPSQLLEVAGNIAIPAANDYTYSTAKTGYASISASAFQLAHIATGTPGISTTTVTSGNYKTIDGGLPGVLGYFHAPVSLPDGAVVTQLDFYIWDNDGTYEASGDLLRINLGASAVNTMATTAGTGAAAASGSVATVIDNTISFATVDNSLYGYYVRFNTYEITANLRIYGARVTYTVTKAD